MTTPEAARLVHEAKLRADSYMAAASFRNGDKMMAAEREKLHAAIDALAALSQPDEARDARRYRHLTDVHGPRSELCFDGEVCAGKAEFDAMIDASIAAMSQEGEGEQHERP